MGSKQRLGMPWRHDGVQCDGCNASPILGNRYKSVSRDDQNLCESCYRVVSDMAEGKFSMSNRSAGSPPFQIWYVLCDGCGQAPIKGPRYRHVDAELDNDLCGTCFSVLPAEDAQNYQYLATTTVSTLPGKTQLVYHFDRTCSSCDEFPICGPCFVCTRNGSEESLCAACYSQNHADGEWRRIFRPDDAEVVHIALFGCHICGALPICGTAYYISPPQECENLLCANCMNGLTEKEVAKYTELPPPSAPELLSSGASSTEDKLTVSQVFSSLAELTQGTISSRDGEISHPPRSSSLDTAPPPQTSALPKLSKPLPDWASLAEKLEKLGQL